MSNVLWLFTSIVCFFMPIHDTTTDVRPDGSVRRKHPFSSVETPLCPASFCTTEVLFSSNTVPVITNPAGRRSDAAAFF